MNKSTVYIIRITEHNIYYMNNMTSYITAFDNSHYFYMRIVGSPYIYIHIYGIYTYSFTSYLPFVWKK